VTADDIEFALLHDGQKAPRQCFDLRSPVVFRENWARWSRNAVVVGGVNGGIEEQDRRPDRRSKESVFNEFGLACRNRRQ
jgi:hypothetical protein